jgi:hypothetical protein
MHEPTRITYAHNCIQFLTIVRKLYIQTPPTQFKINWGPQSNICHRHKKDNNNTVNTCTYPSTLLWLPWWWCNNQPIPTNHSPTHPVQLWPVRRCKASLDSCHTPGNISLPWQRMTVCPVVAGLTHWWGKSAVRDTVGVILAGVVLTISP